MKIPFLKESSSSNLPLITLFVLLITLVGLVFVGYEHFLGPENTELAKAEKLVMMTNIPGVMDKAGNLLTDLTAREIDALFADGTISGGMLPKISSALDAAKSGVNSVHIIDGRIEHSLLLEILTEQAFGTMIRSR